DANDRGDFEKKNRRYEDFSDLQALIDNMTLSGTALENYLYDNVHFNRHGQSTGGFVKKSYNIDFNKTQRFQWSPDAPRVADIDLLTNWADKSKVRHPLAWEIMRGAGVNAHFAFTVRVEQNGQFFSTADFVEDGDDIYLERAGLNRDGALYKVYSNRLNKDSGDSADSGVEKKNRKGEDNSDLQALIDGLDLTGPALVNYMRDNVDIPKCVNMLAANSVIRNIDMHSKNWYIYRDTGKSGEWAILPWDLDLSGGRVWNSQNTYFDNGLYTNGLVVTGNSIRLVSHLFGNAETRAMILRRIRTLSDEFLQPESTPLAERWYERRLDEQSALIDDPAMAKSDAQLDFEKWGSWIQGSGSKVSYTNSNPDVESMAEAVVRWKTEYLPGRRNEIYNRQTVGNGGEIPLPQTDGNNVALTPLVQAGDAGFAFSPTNDSLGSTWLGAPADEPFDTNSWISGPTGFGYEDGSGYEPMIGTNVRTQMSSNNSLYIRIPFNVADPSAFDRLELRMQWDDGFVAYLNGDLLTAANNPAQVTWNSSSDGNGPEANAGSYSIYDVTSRLGSLRPGQNILAIHGLNQSTGSSDFIIRPELYGTSTTVGPPGQPALQFGAIEFSPASGNQDEEYVEITNPFN
ncbi:MAG: CotH kinase family protein, partial [Verrucomicrobiales bacterium]